MTVGKSNFERKESDFYQTPAWVTEALIRNLPVRGLTVWEPSAGNHAICDVLRDNGAVILSSDIEVYATPHNFFFDFLDPDTVPPWFYYNAIITNPPYGPGNRSAMKYAELALARTTGPIALLLPDVFDFGKSRHRIFGGNPRFRGKIQLVDRIQWFEGAGGNTTNHAWYLWYTETPPPFIKYEKNRDG